MVGFLRISLTLAIALGLSASSVLAAPVQAPTGQGLEISDPIIEKTVNPGESFTLNIRVRNITRGDLLAIGQTDDFGAKGEEGQPQILLNEDTTRYSLRQWVAPIKQMRLAPGEAKVVPVNINVPANAEPGGHYGVIRFTAVPPELEGTGVSLSASIGSLVLIRVNGDIEESARLASFVIRHKDRDGSFFEAGPLAFIQRVENTGTVHVKPTGLLKIKGAFLNQELAVNPLSSNILPGSIRRFEQTLDQKFMIGRYTASLDLTYADGKKISHAASFWVIPYRLLALILILLIVTFFVLRSSIRSYNEKIIERARRR